jgi:hypothetical protein
VTAPDFTIADVLAWARTKPADEVYNYADFRNCAICQFLKETGRCADPAVTGSRWRCRSRGGRIYASFDKRINAAANGPRYKDTFGELVERLEKLCPETHVPPSAWARLDAYMADIELASA